MIIKEYILFSDEQKHQANTVDLEDYLLRRGEKLLPSGRDKRLATNHSVTIRGSEWFDHDTQQGGHAIDFVMYLRDTRRSFLLCFYDTLSHAQAKSSAS